MGVLQHTGPPPGKLELECVIVTYLRALDSDTAGLSRIDCDDSTMYVSQFQVTTLDLFI